MKIGLIREGKYPPDRRVAFTPVQLRKLNENYSGKFEFFVQPSSERSFSDDEYIACGISIVEDISNCEVLLGIKEVPVNQLIYGKTYFFFSHTLKKQSYNRNLLKTILDNNIRLIDYEALRDEEGNRLVGYGKWAGIVGAYNGLWTYGMKSGLYDIKRAFECADRKELEVELSKVQLPPIKIVVTGSGRSGKGVMEVMEAIGIKQVTSHELVHSYYEEPVFSFLTSSEYNRRKTDGGYDRKEFHHFPEKYESHFMKFAEVSDLFISAAYWDPRGSKLFQLRDVQSDDFNISVIADITCDIKGSIPTTLKPSTVLDPVFDIDRETFEVLPPFSKQNSISVMAIGNLPTELPRESSEDFGEQLIQFLVPELLKENSVVLDRATIAKEGDLTVEFIYLKDFVNGSAEYDSEV